MVSGFSISMDWREIGVGDARIRSRDWSRVVAGIGDSGENEKIFAGRDWETSAFRRVSFSAGCERQLPVTLRATISRRFRDIIRIYYWIYGDSA